MTNIFRTYNQRLYGELFMFEELKNDGIIVELKALVDKADEFKSDLDCYCEFMLESFLSTSGQN